MEEYHLWLDHQCVPFVHSKSPKLPKAPLNFLKKAPQPGSKSPMKAPAFSPLKVASRKLIPSVQTGLEDESVPLSKRIRQIRLKAKSVKDKAIRSLTEGVPKIDTEHLPNIYRTPKRRHVKAKLSHNGGGVPLRENLYKELQGCKKKIRKNFPKSPMLNKRRNPQSKPSSRLEIMSEDQINGWGEDSLNPLEMENFAFTTEDVPFIQTRKIIPISGKLKKYRLV